MRTYAFTRLFLGTASKKYIKMAQQELKEIDREAKVIDHFPDGIFSFSISMDRDKFVRNIVEKRPVFLRHIHPIDRLIFIDEPNSAPESVEKALPPLVAKIPPKSRIAVQARRTPGDYDRTLFTFKQVIDSYLTRAHIGTPTVKRPDVIISIYSTDSTRIDCANGQPCEGTPPSEPISSWGGIVMLGISSPDQNLCEWSGGVIRFAREENQASRSEFKLLEAFEIFPIEMTPGAKALDLGASPGGWTRVLAEKGYKVTAVDKAPLEPSIAKHKNVRFFQTDAKFFRAENQTFDLLTSDINRDPFESAKIANNISNSIKNGAPLIMTIKLPGKDISKTIAKTISILENSYRIREVRQLYHNRDEVTVWAEKK